MKVFWVSYMFDVPSIMNGTANKDDLGHLIATPAGGGTPRRVCWVHNTYDEAKAEAHDHCKGEADKWNKLARQFK